MVAKAKPRKITSIRKKQSKVVCGVGDGWSIIQRRHYIAFYLIENQWSFIPHHIYSSDNGDHKICVWNGGLCKSCVTLLWTVILYFKKIILLHRKLCTTEMSLKRNKTEHFDQYVEVPQTFVISNSTKLQRFKLNLKQLSFSLTRTYQWRKPPCVAWSRSIMIIS
jgi:hypothetical protein